MRRKSLPITAGKNSQRGLKARRSAHRRAGDLTADQVAMCGQLVNSAAGILAKRPNPHRGCRSTYEAHSAPEEATGRPWRSLPLRR